MPVSREFRAYVLEQLEGFALVTARPMFGGYGLYAGGVMFAVLDDDEMFLRAAEATRAEFAAAGSRPFAPIPGAKPMLGYWLVPGDVLEDRALLPVWAERARQAALAAKKAPARKTARKAKARR
ncbi:MAG: TfoX/Sxy family protein [Acidobacteriota bacterium]